MLLSFNFCLIASIMSLFTGGKAPLSMGDEAPEFRLYDQEGYVHSLVQHRGEFVLLFFYPKDFVYSSVKTVDAFEKAYSILKKHNVVIYGVSIDFPKTHLLFHEKFQLSYDLLSDPDEEMTNRYEAKGLLGRRFISYLIGPDGKIFRKYENESPFIHPSLALHDVEMTEKMAIRQKVHLKF